MRHRSSTVHRRRRITAPVEVTWGHVVGRGWLGFDDGDPAAGDRVRLRDPFGGGGPRDARVLTVDSHRTLQLEWWPAGRPDDRSVVTISLRGAGAHTDVSVTEHAVPTSDVRGRAAAWSSCLQALAGVVQRGARSRVRADHPFARSVL